MSMVADNEADREILDPEQAKRVVEADAMDLAERAKSIQIATDDEYEFAAEFLNGAKATASKVKAVFDPIVAQAHAAHKAATAARSQMLAPIEEAERTVKRAMASFVDKRESERREAERVAAEEARNRAEEERLARAVALEAEGKAAEAEIKLAAPPAPVVVAPVLAPPPPKVSGVSTKKVWKFEITDHAAVKREFLIPNEAAIRSAVLSLNEGAVAVVGGIRVWQETLIAGRR